MTFRSILCFSLAEVFPPVSLNFAAGASMVLKPEEYLMRTGSSVSCSSVSLCKSSYLKSLH